MKSYWFRVVLAAALTAGAAAQTGASGSAATNTSATAGQTGANANANASGSAQVSGGSANVNAGSQAEASGKHEKAEKKQDSKSSGGSSSGDSNIGGALNSGTTLQAELTKSLDAKKAKPGDEVTAKATQDVRSNGQVVVRKGSKLVGHVTEAQARSKENAESKLGILFDHAVLKDGSQVNFNAVVQALAAAQTSSLPVADDGGMASGSGMARQQPMGGGGVVGGVAGSATSAVGSTVGGVTNAAGSVAGSTTGAAGSSVNGTLNGTTRGVVGLQGLTLNTVASGSAAAQGSVISSTTQNVRLDSGTQMVLQVTGAPQQ